MSTLPASTVNAEPDSGLWVTISELARRHGVDKAAVSRRVARLVEDGLLTTKPGPRGSKLVNVAAYDHATNQTTDLGKVLGAETKKIMAGADLPLATPIAAAPDAAPQDNGDSARLRTAKADREVYEAEISKLNLAKERKLVLPIAGKHGVEEAMVNVAEKIVTSIERIPSRAADLTAACAREGELGARKLLKEIAHQLRDVIAREMRMLEQTGLAAEAAGPIETEITVVDLA